MREELVAAAVAFLQHASVGSISPEQKAAFIREKGLTDVEVAEAFRRVSLPVPVIAPVPVTPAPVPASSSSPILSLLKWIAAAGLGAGLFRYMAGYPSPAAPLATPSSTPHRASDSDDDDDLSGASRIER
jgi:hypothetical protein